jgi:trehalose 6-phosphate phosphatase
MPVTIDPRRHDAVLFDAALGNAPALVGCATPASASSPGALTRRRFAPGDARS